MRNAKPSGTFLVAALAACTTSTTPHTCDAEFTGAVCLDMSAAGGLTTHQAVIQEEVEKALAVVQPLLGVTDLRISLIDDPNGVIPETGFGGYNPSAGEVRLFADSAWPNLEAVIRDELQPTLAHEIHHAMRRRAIGYGSTLLQAAISEGLADHFSIEVSPGYDPPWATALTEDQLAVWVPEVLTRSSGTYSHPDWFFGTDPSIPRWAGYTVGFELVKMYLEGNPLQRPSTLVGEPANSFVPVNP